jgi:hypothetical protein
MALTKGQKGAIAGGVIGGLVVIGIIVLILYELVWKYTNYGDTVYLTIMVPGTNTTTGELPPDAKQYLSLNAGGSLTLQPYKGNAGKFQLLRPSNVSGNFTTNKPFVLRSTVPTNNYVDVVNDCLGGGPACVPKHEDWISGTSSGSQEGIFQIATAPPVATSKPVQHQPDKAQTRVPRAGGTFTWYHQSHPPTPLNWVRHQSISGGTSFTLEALPATLTSQFVFGLEPA